MTDSSEKELLYGIVSLMLPESILDCFDIVKVDEVDIPATDLPFRPYKRMVNLYLDERDNRTSEQQDYQPNGFTEYMRRYRGLIKHTLQAIARCAWINMRRLFLFDVKKAFQIA